jgi:hypothetical protein
MREHPFSSTLHHWGFSPKKAKFAGTGTAERRELLLFSHRLIAWQRVKAESGGLF